MSNRKPTPMEARYSKAYIERIYQEKDIFALHDAISVVISHRDLPKQFSLFMGILEWCCSTRSGVWQYYEALSTSKYTQMVGELERFGLDTLVEQYRHGMACWNKTHDCRDLDHWIDRNWDEIMGSSFELIADLCKCLHSSK